MPAIAASNGLRSKSVTIDDAGSFRLLARLLFEVAPFLAHEAGWSAAAASRKIFWSSADRLSQAFSDITSTSGLIVCSVRV